MELNDVIKGFKVNKISYVDEIKAEVYEMTHVKTKAELVWLKREDDNKTFSIAFKTIPTDSTGVFHILEHTVLNGSKRFPVKEPFVDLLKGSLQTFLNAMTFNDKTVFPVSSRNNKDFLNLMRVYLDAVFYPNVKVNENIFRQEGWHYELNDKDELPLIKGVVYNEMKGAYSSPDRLASEVLMGQIFPDNCYGFSSGGNPDNIPELTYQQFKDAHDKYYSPTNSKIFLDGKMDIEEVLAIISEEYLNNFEKNNDLISIDFQKPIVSEKKYINFEATDRKAKDIVDYGWVIGRFDDYAKNVAFNILSSILCDDNQAVLQKAILENGLAEDVYCGLNDGLLQPFFELTLYNVEDKNVEKLDEVIKTTLQKIVDEGLNKDDIIASLNKLEFHTKERDYGSEPKGIIYDIQALSTWLYGGSPIDGIVCDSVFDFLREKVNTSFFEDLIQEYLIDSKHCGCVVARPSLSLQSQRASEMEKQMREYKASLSEEQLTELLQFNKQFAAWQKEVDTPEQKATLPKLSLADIEENPIKLTVNTINHQGIKVLSHDDNTEGIDYRSIFFDCNDMNLDELMKISLLTNFIGQLETTNNSSRELSKLKKSYLGAFNVGIVTYYDKKNDVTNTGLEVNYSYLHKNADKAKNIVFDILENTIFTNVEEMQNIIKQNKTGIELAVSSRGNVYGMRRVRASLSEAGVIDEYVSGITYAQFIKQIADNLNDALVDEIKSLYTRILSKERIILVSLMGNNQLDEVDEILKNLKANGKAEFKAEKPLFAKKKEAISVSSKVSYAEVGFDCHDFARDNKGKVAVVGKVLSLDYLWTTIRAMGGAYGAGFVNRNADLIFYSYRDPNPANSLKTYYSTDDYLKEFCNSKETDLLPYIIGTIGDSDPLLTNKTKLSLCNSEALCNITYQDKCEARKQILTMSKDEIMKLNDIFTNIADKSSACVICSYEQAKQLMASMVVNSIVIF